MIGVLLAMTFMGCSNSNKTTSKSSENTTTNNESTTSSEEETTASEYKMIAGTGTPDQHPYNLGLLKMNELLGEKTDGKVVIDLFTNNILGSERDVIEGLQLGTIQLTCASTAPLSGFTDAFLIFDLPFVFANSEQAYAVMDSEVGQEILHSIENQGLIGLTFFENGFRNITNSSHPINVPEDLKGIKIRTMENKIHMASFQVMGADPTPMAWGEVFTALQQGTIDGQENPIPIIETNRLEEVQEYLSLTGHFYSPAPVFVAKEYFESLSEEYQIAIEAAAIEATSYQREQVQLQTEEGVNTLESRGLKINSTDTALFQEATKAITEEYVKDEKGCVSPDIYSRVQEVIASVQ